MPVVQVMGVDCSGKQHGLLIHRTEIQLQLCKKVFSTPVVVGHEAWDYMFCYLDLARQDKPVVRVTNNFNHEREDMFIYDSVAHTFRKAGRGKRLFVAPVEMQIAIVDYMQSLAI